MPGKSEKRKREAAPDLDDDVTPESGPIDALKKLNIPGPDVLRESLTTCSEPLKAIEDFQSENGILLPSLRPMLPLLDLHGVRRLDFHTSVLEEMKEKLLKRIAELGRKDVSEKERKENELRLEELLEKYFPIIRIESLQPVAMAVLKHLDHVDYKYLKELLPSSQTCMSDRSLYEKCDVVVKRQLWQEHQGLFGDEVSPLLTQYINEKEAILLRLDASSDSLESTESSFFSYTPRQRRSNKIIQDLVHMIGKNVLLYDTILQFLRTLFLRTKNVHYCTLRVELLMALHDAEITDVTQMDPVHKFAWCLDACIRGNMIDAKRSKELESFLDGVRKGQEQVLGDISMTLSDPYAVHFLSQTTMKLLHVLISKETVARDNPNLQLVLRLLNMGLHSWDILSSQVYKEPKFDVTIITQFIPILMSLMVDDQVRSLNAKLPHDDREAALATIEHAGPAPDTYQTSITEDRVASVLATYYTFHICQKKDRTGIKRVLGCLSQDNLSFKSYLIPIVEEYLKKEGNQMKDLKRIISIMNKSDEDMSTLW